MNTQSTPTSASGKESREELLAKYRRLADEIRLRHCELEAVISALFNRTSRNYASPMISAVNRASENSPTQITKLLYSRREASEQLSISVRELSRRIAHKEIPYRRVGRRVLIPKQALEAFARRDHAVLSAVPVGKQG